MMSILNKRATVTAGAAAVVFALLALSACGSSAKNATTTSGVPASTATTEDPVAAAEAQVTAAQGKVDDANNALKGAREQFCGNTKTYITAIDRYTKLFTDNKATVGDVKTLGADLTAPKEAVSQSAGAVRQAQDDLASAQQELADAQAALVEAKATASSVPVATTAPAPTTTTTIVPQATIDRVQQAEADLARTSQGITDATPLVQATAAYNSAAFALQIAWLKMFNDAGCLTDAQQAQAVTQVANYTAALQMQLNQAGYYQGPIDGIYGPATVDAVAKLQTDAGLPVTGFMDKATTKALDDKLATISQQSAQAAMTQAAAVQTMLKITGFWTGPIDGKWTDELTASLMRFQTALGVPATGVVDVATLVAFQTALAAAKTALTTTTTTTTATTAPAPTTTRPPETTAAPAPTTEAAPPPETTTTEPPSTT
jgi:peptidoglycan hydrolase-like protein with peptidoglycan-binding domain